MESKDKRDLLRHTLATLSYRGAKVLRDAPEEFGEFTAGDTVRTPLRILAHIGDLLEWALSLAKGTQVWRDSEGESWSAESARFFSRLEELDDYLASDAKIAASEEKLFQGPIADALTHVGQIALLRRLAENPIRGENYFLARIEAGRTGPEQPTPRKEFN
ncbi:MAG: hypothetical protein IPM66_03570 [Acidobacteriota bacterium]|nr:MAG: hypothetical protein IPM66_03570 [Acidobacteriota bacterium]